MTFVVLKNKNEIFEQLKNFLDIFPNLLNRIESLDVYSDKLSKNATCVLMKEVNDNIGFAAFYANDMKTKTGYISLIGVRDDHQGQGYGKELMQYCCESMKKESMKTVKLEVKKENINAKGFYEHLGFKYCANVWGYDRSVYMQKDL